MARGVLPITVIDEVGVAPGAEVAGDATNFHVIKNVPAGRSWIIVRNADVSNPHTMSVKVAVTPGGQAVTPKPYMIAASTSRWIKIGDPSIFGRSVNIDVDSSQLKLTAVTVAL